MTSEEIKEARRKKGMTQVAAAKAIGVSLSGYRLWEYGVGTPNKDNMKKIKEVFGVKR